MEAKKSVLTVIYQGKEIYYPFEYNPILLEFLTDQGYDVPHGCGGNGICHLCKLIVNGRLLPSCQVRMKDGMVVEFPKDGIDPDVTVYDKI